jgi:hypothetical protein
MTTRDRQRRVRLSARRAERMRGSYRNEHRGRSGVARKDEKGEINRRGRMRKERLEEVEVGDDNRPIRSGTRCPSGGEVGRAGTGAEGEKGKPDRPSGVIACRRSRPIVINAVCTPG